MQTARRAAAVAGTGTISVPLWRFYACFLRLGAAGFGGPIALAGFMQRDLVDDRRWIKAFVRGVSAAATGAIAGAAYVLATRALIDVWTAVVAVATFAVLARWKISELWLIAGAFGLLVHE